MHKDSKILISDTIEVEEDGTYRVRLYKCGCSTHALLDEDGKEKGLDGYTDECQFCFYGDDGVPGLLNLD